MYRMACCQCVAGADVNGDDVMLHMVDSDNYSSQFK